MGTRVGGTDARRQCAHREGRHPSIPPKSSQRLTARTILGREEREGGEGGGVMSSTEGSHDWPMAADGTAGVPTRWHTVVTAVGQPSSVGG